LPAPPTVPALVDTGHEYDHLFGIYVPIAIGVFVLIVLAVALAVVRYRGRPPEQAARWYEHNLLEGSYALLLAAVVAFLLYLTFTAEHRVDTVSAREAPAVTIAVTASKWEWTFDYRAYGVTLRSGSVGRQQVVVPANEPVRFELASTDVIHSFWIPALRFKRDAIPGASGKITLDFDHAGVYAGQCAEYCGLRHADMVFSVRALDPPAFRAWAASAAAGAAR
jgi:cytochrome c oxidase subunit 2